MVSKIERTIDRKNIENLNGDPHRINNTKVNSLKVMLKKYFLKVTKHIKICNE